MLERPSTAFGGGVMQAKRAANDLHTFVGLLALHTLALFASLMTVIFALASVMLVALHPEMDKSLLRMGLR
jgi:hypothetical protein